MRLDPRDCWSRGLETDAMVNGMIKWEEKQSEDTSLESFVGMLLGTV
jgi:hypothetical protein